MPKSFTVQKIKRQCAICGKNILAGGHYFGKIPLCTDAEFEKAIKAGTTKERLGKAVIEVLKKDPKPYTHAEYWECPKCYLGNYQEVEK